MNKYETDASLILSNIRIILFFRVENINLQRVTIFQRLEGITFNLE